jgi:excisionase family DNA binding protein
MQEAAKVSEVLTVEEARGRLRISRNAAYQAIERNEIPNVKIGRRILIPRAAFERLLAGEAPQRAKDVA